MRKASSMKELNNLENDRDILVKSEDESKMADKIDNFLQTVKEQQEALGMISPNMSIITIFGHKHLSQNFSNNFDISLEKISILVHGWN